MPDDLIDELTLFLKPRSSRHTPTAQTNLIRRIRPDAGNLSSALRAFSLRSDMIFADLVSTPRHQQLAALRAVGIFQRTHPPGQVAGIHIVQSGFLANFGCPAAMMPKALHRDLSSCNPGGKQSHARGYPARPKPETGKPPTALPANR